MLADCVRYFRETSRILLTQIKISDFIVLIDDGEESRERTLFQILFDHDLFFRVISDGW